MKDYRDDGSFTFAEIEMYNQIVECIYAGTDSNESIQEALEKLKEMVYYDLAFFYIYKKGEDKVRTVKLLTPGLDESMYERYLDEFLFIDDTTELVMGDAPIVYRSSDMFNADHRTETYFYKNFLEPVGIEYSLEENFSLSDNAYFGGLALHRGKPHRDFNEKEMQVIKLLRLPLSYLAERSLGKGSVAFKPDGEINSIVSTKIVYCIWDELMQPVEENITNRQIFDDKDVSLVLQKIKEQLIRLKKKQKADVKAETKQGFVISVNGVLYYFDIVQRPHDEMKKNQCITLLYDFNSIFHSIIEYRCERGHLTIRETEIVLLVIQGLSGQEIAERLGIGITTVKSHLNHIYNKFQIEGKRQLLSAVMKDEQFLQL